MKIEYINRRRNVMTTAWLIARNSDLSFGEALRRAWRNVWLKELLDEGATVNFAFEKADGSMRMAKGCSARAGAATVKGNGRPTPERNTLYWDIEAQGFRSFAKSRLVAIYSATRATDNENAA